MKGTMTKKCGSVSQTHKKVSLLIYNVSIHIGHTYYKDFSCQSLGQKDFICQGWGQHTFTDFVIKYVLHPYKMQLKSCIVHIYLILRVGGA